VDIKKRIFLKQKGELLFKKELFLLLFLLTTHLFALEISVDGAKDNFIKYTTLTISDDDNFTCQDIKDNFNKTTKIICAFSKKTQRKVQNFENDFLKVHTFTKHNHYFVQITPKYKIKLFADIFDLTKDNEFFTADVSLSSRWTILGYKDKLPLIKQISTSDIALNLPFYDDTDKLPYVGSLDIKGNPVYIRKVDDVKEYLEVKKLYKAKKYSQALEMIDTILEKYPNTLFGAELLYYKIKVYSKLKDYDNVVVNAKTFLREYSSDANLPEILSLIAKAYNDLGQNTDADYFFDRLFNEHPNSLYTFWGYIYKGEGLESSGGDKKAEYYYKKALYGTTSLEVAVSAAYHLAHLLLGNKTKEATKYIEKIIKKDPAFFIKDFKTSKDMMYEFADYGYYQTAADMAKAILDSINPSYDEYEEILKDWALWLSKTKHKKEALKALNKYLKAFPDGDYVDAVTIAKDALFFEVDDLNATAKLEQYNKLIEEYGKDTIGKRALYEKAKLLLKEKKYRDVLALQEQLEALDKEEYPDVAQIIHDAVVGSMQNALDNRECKAVLSIANDYNIELSDAWDDGIYRCAMKGGDFQLSKKIAQKHLHSSNIEQRKKWLFRFVKIDYETGNYTELIDAAKDLIALIEKPKSSPYKEVYRYLFDAYERLSQKDNMLQAMLQLENIFGLSYKDIDRYTSMVTLAQELHDATMMIKYAQKVVNIQRRVGAYPQSPYVDFALYQAYIDKGEYKKALNVIAFLDKIELTGEERARQKYLLGNVLDLLKQKAKAKQAYKEAIKASATSAWAQLAQSALSL
jgi:tetratricopeptide (TPR) repeat protein